MSDPCGMVVVWSSCSYDIYYSVDFVQKMVMVYLIN